MGKQTLLLLLFSLCLVIPVTAITTVEAQNRPIHIGIDLSQTCIIMLRQGYPTDCPTYQQVIALHPDTTNKMISGEFTDMDGFYHRMEPPYKNPIRYYDHGFEDKNSVMWIDPPQGTHTRMKLITIHPEIPEFKTVDSYQKINNTVYTAKDRWVSERCNKASISATKWTTLLGDTIRYMVNNCDPQFTTFNNVVERNFEQTVFDISTSYKYQLESWIKEMLERCKTKGCV